MQHIEKTILLKLQQNKHYISKIFQYFFIMLKKLLKFSLFTTSCQGNKKTLENKNSYIQLIIVNLYHLIIFIFLL